MAVDIHDCAVAPGILVDPLDCRKPLFGLDSVADIQPIGDPHMENGVEWQPYSCDAADLYCNTCTVPGDPKTYNHQPDLKVAPPFAVYGSFKCSTVGFTRDEAQNRAQRNLEYGEWRTIEEQFWTDLSTATDVTDLSGMGAASIVAGLSALEAWAGANMGCLPTIHAPRSLMATMSNSSLFPQPLGKALTTFAGSLVSAGGGFTDVGPGSSASAGEAWLYVTGPVRIWQSEVFEVPPSADASMIDRASNDLLALAERVVLIGRECSAAAILVKTEGCGC